MILPIRYPFCEQYLEDISRDKRSYFFCIDRKQHLKYNLANCRYFGEKTCNLSFSDVRYL